MKRIAILYCWEVIFITSGLIIKYIYGKFVRYRYMERLLREFYTYSCSSLVQMKPLCGRFHMEISFDFMTLTVGQRQEPDRKQENNAYA